MTKSAHDWRVHQARLHMHGNHKFQSVYTRREEPVFEETGTSEDVIDVLILIMSTCVLMLVMLLAAFKLIPGIAAWLGL